MPKPMEVTITTRQEVQIKRKITLTEEEYHTLIASKNGVPVSVLGKNLGMFETFLLFKKQKTGYIINNC